MAVATMIAPSGTEVLNKLLRSDPAWWIEENFYVEDPRDPVTGEQFEPGPIRLADHQKRIIRAALTKVNGLFPFTTIVYSTIKKSGKTRLAAGIGAWYADTQGQYNEVYCLANDGKQSSDRILSAIRKGVELSPHLDWEITKTRIVLPTGTFIEAIPCDPTGQAGANPGVTVWSEMWGFRHEYKERLWTEMTVPPTRYGKAFRLVESYAGYSGESNVLEHLYDVGVRHGMRHPLFPDIPVYINIPARTFVYWDTGEAARRMPWQTPEYYSEESQLLTPSEYGRIHENIWAEALDKAIPLAWWDRLEDAVIDGERLPPIERNEPVVLGVDASVSQDCCAMIAVTRHPKRHKDTAVRIVRVWEPPRGGAIDYSVTLEPAIREMCSAYNVVEVTYDKYQLHMLMTNLRRDGVSRMFQFDQGPRRALADKQLFDKIVRREIVHNGDAVLRAHVNNAAAATKNEKYRFVKMTASLLQGITAKPIDALVATSMADYEASRLNI